MPNRLIKESICSSEKMNSLSDFSFRLWAHLVTYVDDYGRGDARPAIIKGRCFPLREMVTIQTIKDGLDDLAKAGCILLYEVKGESFLCFPNWDKHQTVRNKKSKYPAPDAVDGDLKAIDFNCNQLSANESKCPRNPIQSVSESISVSVSESMIDDDDAEKIQHDHNTVLDAALNAGFKSSPAERAGLLNLYAVHGLEKMLNGINECVKHSAPNLAYLEAVLKGTPKKKGDATDVHGYEQRDYSGEQAAAMARMMQDDWGTA